MAVISGKVSFLIAAFNEEKFIVECIESCLEQSYPNIEVVVVDDGSTDGTAWQIRSYLDDRIKFIKFDTNRGKVAAFNSAFFACDGDFISLIGADDVNARDRIKDSLKVLVDGGYDLVVGDLEACDANLETIEIIRAPKNWDIFDLMVGNRLAGGAVLFKREFAELVFPIPDQLRFEDWWIGFITGLRGRYGLVGEVVTRYRQHGTNDIGIAGSSSYRRAKDWKRHDAYYSAFRDYLEMNPELSSRELLSQLEACRRMKKMYLARDIWERWAIGFVPKQLPRGIRWSISYMIVMIFGRAGLDAIIEMRKLVGRPRAK